MGKAIFKSAVHMLITKNNKILLQKRKGSKLWPGYYALPAGHIDENENQYDALIREAKEELGIDIDPKNIINSGYHLKLLSPQNARLASQIEF